ncbi:MAG TPA: uroporphyrinogen decarboxylase family protein [bacterium]|nr:uroporphyrinogen decarboxylase family protein [bacterium]
MVYIPGFLVNKIYERGSLRNNEDGFELCFCNTMTPIQISGMRDFSLDVDGNRRPAEKIRLSLGANLITLGETGLEKPVSFARDEKLVIKVSGPKLADGGHVVKISFITNEYGGATLKISDRIGSGPAPSLWQRITSMLSGGRAGKARGPVTVSGELGGVPLDPDFSRLATALRREEPDRVPLFEAEIAIPIQEWFLGHEINGAEDEVEFYIRAGYDYVPVLPPFLTPRLMRTASERDGRLEDADRERAWLTESEGLIKTIKDVERFPWPNPDEVDFSAFHEMDEILPPKMKTLGMLSPAAIFGNTSQAMGLQNFSYALFDDRAVVEAMFEIIGNSYLKIARKLIGMPRLGAVFMSDDLAHTGGLLVSPEVYRKYVFPWYRKIGEVLDSAGLPFIFHSDGNIIPVLDDLADCGIKAIHPIEPQAMDIVEVKKKFGDRFCIFGNIDLDYTLTLGSTDEVEAKVKERIKKLAPGGGYGLAASNSVPDYVKPENYRKMVESAKRYGRYPINIS